MAKTSRLMNNPAKRKPIDAEQAKKIANREAFLDTFNPAYNQVMLRFSNAKDGLRNGAPPPRFVEWDS